MSNKTNFPFSNDYYRRNGKDPHILIIRGVSMDEKMVLEKEKKEDKFYSLMNDFAFKWVFGQASNSKILIRLLNTFLFRAALLEGGLRPRRALALEGRSIAARRVVLNHDKILQILHHKN